MFKRRTPRTLIEKGRETIWPSMGWSRVCAYFKHRVLRLSDTARNIALGLAIGAGVSFSPLIMTHLIHAALFAFIARANIAAALIGTLIGNPWTFPFIWWASITLGSYLFGAFGLPASTALPDNITFNIIWDLIWHDPARIFMPWMVGGYLLCAIIIAVLYPIYFYLVRSAQRARTKRNNK